jgi:hypothetical protein
MTGQGYNFGGEKARTMMKRAHRINHATKVNAFAGLLAEGASVATAARTLGEKPSWGQHTLTAIRRALGPQAV